MQCCQDTYTTLTNGNCPTYKDTSNNIRGGRIPSEQLNPDLALAACPNYQSQCGTTPYYHYGGNTAQTNTVTVTALAGASQLIPFDKCTYVITTENVKAPGF